MPRVSRSPGPGQWSSISKALLVLRAFVDHQDQWGVKELATAIDQPPSSTHRLLQILRAEGLVEWNAENQKYFVGVEFQRWAASLTSRSRRHDLARRAAETVAGTLDTTCWFAVYDAPRHRMVYVAEAHGPAATPRDSMLGLTVPLTASATGLAVLSALPDDLKQSEPALDDQNFVAAVAKFGKKRFASFAQADGRENAIAVPVPDGRQQPIGALSVIVPASLKPAGTAAAVAALATAAQEMTHRMGGRIIAGVPGTAPHDDLALVADLARQRLPELSLHETELRNLERLSAIEEGNAGYGAVTLDRLEAAYFGKPPFRSPHQNLRLMGTLAPLHLHILVRQDSRFETIADLQAARISAGERSFITADVWRGLAMLLAPSIRARKQVQSKLIDYGYNDAIQGFLDGTIDALVTLNKIPVPALLDLAQHIPIRCIAVDGDLAARFVARHPTYRLGNIPAGSYTGLSVPVATLTTPLVMVTSAARSTEEVFQVAAAVEENGRLSAIPDGTVDPLLADFIPLTAVPMHPGAANAMPRR